MSFSSYPGELASDDDFYMTSSKLVVLETTNHIYNFTILEVRKRQQLSEMLCFVLSQMCAASQVV
jgi:hypothetical protein